uniref:glycosyltransferase n=1 Tax=uncultured Tenacibaculum sp. TaxID=174713 RepID=UPI002613E1AD|nr:glycosyltransferase [uncultured Tenacibaculum sp.]
MRAKGHVLYIGGFEMPDKNAAAHRVVANAKLMSNLGYEITLIGVTKNVKQRQFISTTKKEYDGIAYYEVKYPTSIKSWMYYVTSISHIKKIAKENKVTHIIGYNYPGIALFKLKKFSRKKSIKLLADVTEWYEAKQGSLAFKIIKKTDVFIRMKLVQPKLDGLIVISDYLQDYYKDKLKNIVNLPPLVDLSMERWNIIPQIKEDNKEVKLIYAGSPGAGEKDRLDLIIEALINVKKKRELAFKMNIIGLTKEQFFTSFNIKEGLVNSIDEVIVFKGRLPHDEVLREIRSADFKVFVRDENLTNQAGFPTKYVEAISCGTPVLTNDSSNIVNFFKEGRTGFLLNNKNAATLEESFLNIFTKETLVKIPEMKLYCRKSKKFDISNFRDSFNYFLNEI